MKGVYFDVSGRVYYIAGKGLRKGCCHVCGKRRVTTAHHIIPRRAACVHPVLKEVRIRVCSACEKKIHPENPYTAEDIISKMRKNNENLKEAIYWRSMKINALVQKINSYKNVPEFKRIIEEVNNMKDEDFYIKHEPENNK